MTTEERYAHWREVIGKQNTSGLSIAEYCRNENIRSSYYYAWRSRIRKRQRVKHGFIELSPAGTDTGIRIVTSTGFHIEGTNRGRTSKYQWNCYKPHAMRYPCLDNHALMPPERCIMLFAEALIGEDFTDKDDYQLFLKRLGNLLMETQTSCFAWALIPNHFHLLLRTVFPFQL